MAIFFVLITVAILFVCFATRNYRPEEHNTKADEINEFNYDEYEKPQFTQDDIIYKDGEYHENEFSEDWEDFEYQFEEDRRKK